MCGQVSLDSYWELLMRAAFEDDPGSVASSHRLKVKNKHRQTAEMPRCPQFFVQQLCLGRGLSCYRRGA